MAYVIVEGSGSYRVDNFKFTEGATEVTDPVVLQKVRDAGLDWIYVQDHRKKDAPAASVIDPNPPAAEPEPYTKFTGRDGKWYFVKPPAEGGDQVGPFATEDEVDVAIAAALLVPDEIPLADDIANSQKSKESENGAMTAADTKPTDFACAHCGKSFKSNGARANHERLKHPEGSVADKAPAPTPPATPKTAATGPMTSEDVKS